MIYDNKIEQVGAQELSSNQFEVKLKLSLNKLRVVGIENEQALEFTRPIEISFYQFDESGKKTLIEKIEIKENFKESDYTYTFSQRPDLLVLDPDLTFLDKNISDNKRQIDCE